MSRHGVRGPNAPRAAVAVLKHAGGLLRRVQRTVVSLALIWWVPRVATIRRALSIVLSACGVRGLHAQRLVRQDHRRELEQ